MNEHSLKIGSDFPKISLTDIKNKTITISDDINSKYCIVLFLEVLGDQNAPFSQRGIESIVFFLSDQELRLLQQAWTVSMTQNFWQMANAFQIVKKQCRLHFVMGLPMKQPRRQEHTGTIIQREKTNTILWGKAMIICNPQNL